MMDDLNTEVDEHHAALNSLHKRVHSWPETPAVKTTVAEAIEWLKQWPANATISGYEGEGGSWLCVDWEPDK